MWGKSPNSHNVVLPVEAKLKLQGVRELRNSLTPCEFSLPVDSASHSNGVMVDGVL
jgi:hypothetical protein